MMRVNACKVLIRLAQRDVGLLDCCGLFNEFGFSEHAAACFTLQFDAEFINSNRPRDRQQEAAAVSIPRHHVVQALCLTTRIRHCHIGDLNWRSRHCRQRADLQRPCQTVPAPKLQMLWPSVYAVSEPTGTLGCDQIVIRPGETEIVPCEQDLDGLSVTV